MNTLLPLFKIYGFISLFFSSFAITEQVINILSIVEIVAVQGCWQTVLPSQWRELSKIPEFDKEIVEKITKISLNSFLK
jgi:hypothetical protein